MRGVSVILTAARLRENCTFVEKHKEGKLQVEKILTSDKDWHSQCIQ